MNEWDGHCDSHYSTCGIHIEIRLAAANITYISNSNAGFVETFGSTSNISILSILPIIRNARAK